MDSDNLKEQSGDDSIIIDAEEYMYNSSRAEFLPQNEYNRSLRQITGSEDRGQTLRTSGTERRRVRPTNSQLNAMVDFFYKNNDLLEGNYSLVTYKMLWEGMSQILNAMGGAYKTSTQWQMVWHDLKSRIEARMCVGKNDFTQVERRIVDLLDATYSFESKASNDSVSKEDEEQVVSDDGNEFAANNDEESFQEDVLLMPLENGDMVTCPPLDIFLKTGRRSEENESGKRQNEYNFPNNTEQPSKKERLKDDGLSEKYLLIAKQQSDAMQMLAESSRINADAAISTAQALQSIATSLEIISGSFKTSSD